MDIIIEIVNDIRNNFVYECHICKDKIIVFNNLIWTCRCGSIRKFIIKEESDKND